MILIGGVYLKKLLFAMSICLMLVGCSSAEGESNEGESKVSMDSFVKGFEAEGIVFDSKEKPMFSIIGAKDGVIFYNDDQPVKIYEFDSTEAIKKAEESMPIVKDWEQNGLFLLETTHEESKEIFKTIK